MIAPRKLTLAATGALGVWLLLWYGWLNPPRDLSRVLACFIAVLPLLLVAAPLLRDKASAYAWCGFIALGYMCHVVAIAFVDPANRWLAAIELIFVGVLFVASGAALRTRRAQTAADGHSG
jgi:uncharacterized membrane protein